MANILNRVAQTTTTDDTGTLTLGSAIAQHVALLAADDGEAFDWVLLDADDAAFEVGRAGVYTHSGTTFTRPSGNVERSSNSDALIDLSVGTHTLFLTPTARRYESVLLPQIDIAPVGANITATLNRLHLADVSGMTANRNFVIGAGVPGDCIALKIQTGDASYVFGLIGDTGISLNGGAAATLMTSVYMDNEYMEFVCTSTTNWAVTVDGRSPSMAKHGLNDNATGETAATWTKPTDASGTWTEVFDVGGLGNTSTGTFTIRRAGKYTVAFFFKVVSNPTDGYYIAGILLEGANVLVRTQINNGAASPPYLSAVNQSELAVGETVEFKFQTQDGSLGCRGALNNTHVSVVEVL